MHTERKKNMFLPGMYCRQEGNVSEFKILNIRQIIKNDWEVNAQFKNIYIYNQSKAMLGVIEMSDLRLEYSYIQMQTFGIECKVINPTQSFGIESNAEICKLKREYI